MYRKSTSPLPPTVLAVAVAMLAATAGVEAQSGPAPDSARLLRDLSVLAHDSMEGRAPGTPGGLRARAFLQDALAGTGAAPVGGAYGHPFRWDAGRGVNFVASIPGEDGDTQDVIFLTAHYDHLGIRNGEIYNGADDNASGTAAALEIARTVVASPLEHTLVVALLDAEEEGEIGAEALLDDPPVPLERIALDVNLDMVSRTAGVLWASGTSHTPALRPVLEAVAADAPVDVRLGHDRPGAPEGDDWTQSSDHWAFHERGIPFVYFGVEDHPDYHRPTDDFERVDPGEYMAAVRTIMTALRALDRTLPLPNGPA